MDILSSNGIAISRLYRPSAGAMALGHYVRQLIKIPEWSAPRVHGRDDFLEGMTASGRLPAHFAHPTAISVRPAAATMAAAPAPAPSEAAPHPARYVRRRPAGWRHGRARG